MKLHALLGAALAAGLSLSSAATAQDFMLKDAYARSSTPSSKSGAAFFELMNTGEVDDRLIGASADFAPRVELHSHSQDTNGVMRMGQIEGGVSIAAGESHMFKRGGDHMMFMGLSAPFVQGTDLAVTLVFEKAGEVVVQIPVDHERKPDHGTMKHD